MAEVSAVPGHDGSPIHVYDPVDKRKWLVDGGALLSIAPLTPAQRAKGPVETILRAANAMAARYHALIHTQAGHNR